MKSYRRIAAVKTAIEILRFLSDQDEPVSGAEIAKALDIPQGTTMCHLATLEDEGFVGRTSDSYELGQDVAVMWAKRKALLELKINRYTQDLNRLEG